VLSREETASGVRIVDAAGYACTVSASDWTDATPTADFHVRPDERTAGVTTSLTVPASTVTVRTADGTESLEPGSERRFETPPELVDATGALGVLLAFDAPATLSFVNDALTVSFDGRARVDLGFLARSSSADHVVRVPETPSGLATAVGAMAAAHRTTTPERARPTMRRQPPSLRYADEVSIPDAVADAVPDTGIRVEVPDDVGRVLAVAPLAYYLGATVETGFAESRVVAPEAGVDHALDDGEAARLLERAFWADTAACQPALSAPGEDATGRSLAERLRSAVEYSGSTRPEWPLAIYADASFEYARALPAVLHRLAHVYPAETTPLDGRELVERTLDDFYRTTPGPVATVEMENPRLRSARTHGWLADGTPIDVFKALPEAFDHGHDPTGDALSVAVVLNDPGMTREHDRVASVYERTAVPLSVSLHADLSRDALAGVFEAETDFVHYIGHCDRDGLLCADGRLSASALGSVGARTFFLNACGSYEEGLELVRRGSAAGAVTFRKVLDEHAARVGTAFARLLVAGFTVERALSLARRRIVMGKDYAVVGDGTWTLPNGRTSPPGVFTANGDGDAYSVTYDAGDVWTHGETYRSPFPGRGVQPYGAVESARLSANDLASVLADADAPVVLDGDFVWADEAAVRLYE